MRLLHQKARGFGVVVPILLLVISGSPKCSDGTFAVANIYCM